MPDKLDSNSVQAVSAVAASAWYAEDSGIFIVRWPVKCDEVVFSDPPAAGYYVLVPAGTFCSRQYRKH
jgi:hypothetical protein